MTQPAVTAGRKILCLFGDAFGGTGGIALYNRDVVSALCSNPRNARIVCLPRVAPNPLEPVPERCENDQSGLGGKFAYARAVLRQARQGPIDLVYCGHVNLIPLAQLAAAISGAPWMFCIYGTDAWAPLPRLLPRLGAARADGMTAVSGVTLERFLRWCPIDPSRCTVVHNAIHLDRYAMTPKDPALLARYGLAGRKVIMTVGRLDPADQAKGFDRVIELLPSLVEDVPNLSYLVVGKGGDLPRLQALAHANGVADRVIFTGFIAEEEKAAHYNIADAYVMPSVGEGFGYVFVEALACGVPCVGSTADGGREALLEGEFGALVDPFDKPALKAAILAALQKPKAIPARLSYYSFDNFAARLNQKVDQVIARASG